MQSLDFVPVFGVYDSNGALLLSSTTSADSRTATANFTIPTDGFYDIDATTLNDGQGGL
jgi:hypothetical protein